MSNHKKDLIETLLIWAGIATSVVVYILPWLQFAAVVLAIYISIKKIRRDDKQTIQKL
jgi:hypothetical protein